MFRPLNLKPATMPNNLTSELRPQHRHHAQAVFAAEAIETLSSVVSCAVKTMTKETRRKTEAESSMLLAGALLELRVHSSDGKMSQPTGIPRC
ncbi:hypothetical protein EC968_008079 [Mortierella alpina]|nr:hypothetical protein EC968_008079 [Mortierella alpina]